MDPGIIVPIFLFGGAAAVLWKYFEGRNKERMAMIEKGVNPVDFKGASPFRFFRSNVLNNLKWGLLFLFVGFGLLAGEQLYRVLDISEEAAVFGSIFILGGLGLILFYFIASNKVKDKQPDEE
jgi:hypothetical protein